jgi:hypothetical protein
LLAALFGDTPAFLKLISAPCAVLIVLVNTLPRPSLASDASAGFVAGLFLGISILALRAGKQKRAYAR